MIVVTVEFRFPADRVDEAREAMARVVNATRAEPGCITYSYAEDVLDPGLIRICEKWVSREALDAHFAMPHMETWKREREAFGLTGRSVMLCEAGAETAV